jgi:hypothetical protein
MLSNIIDYVLYVLGKRTLDFFGVTDPKGSPKQRNRKS